MPVTPAAKPASVPAAAVAVAQTTKLGTIERRANQAPLGVDLRTLSAASCRDAVITLATDRETIYGARSCDGFWDQRAHDVFVGQQIAIVLEVTDVRFRILVQTLDGSQGEFTVAGIWVQ